VQEVVQQEVMMKKMRRTMGRRKKKKKSDEIESIKWRLFHKRGAAKGSHVVVVLHTLHAQVE
jgi:hypothetical protein